MTTLIKRTLLAVAVASFGMTGAAQANEQSFESLDANKDGALSPAETATVEGLNFVAADANGDGVLSPEEYEKAAGA